MEYTPAEYNGQVEVGGPAQIRELPGITISKLAVGPLDNNTYLLTDIVTGEKLLIDVANEADRILDLCSGQLNKVLTTHCHLDHWLALADVVIVTGAQTHATAAEAAQIDVPTNVEVADGDEIVFGSSRVKIVTLAGHRATYTDHVSTSACAILEDATGKFHVFPGDCLFPGGIGNTCDDQAARAQLLNDVVAKLFRLPDDTVIYPGHGFDTTLGAERPYLEEWARGS